MDTHSQPTLQLQTSDWTLCGVVMIKSSGAYDLLKTSSEAAITRTEEWYHDLIAKMLKAGYTSTLVMVEMGSRGLSNMPGFQRLCDILL